MSPLYRAPPPPYRIAPAVASRNAGPLRTSRRTEQEAAPPPAAAPAPSGESRIDQLKALGELKSQGVLSDEEFEAEKARILG